MIQIKSIAVVPEDDGQARVEAKLFNSSAETAPAMLLMLNFHDTEGRIRDRISIRLNPFEAGGSQTARQAFRLKNNGFFSYSTRLEKPAV